MVRAVARLLQCKTFIPYARSIYQHRRTQTQVHHKTQYAPLPDVQTTSYGCAHIGKAEPCAATGFATVQIFAGYRRYRREGNGGETRLQTHALERRERTSLGKHIDPIRSACRGHAPAQRRSHSVGSRKNRSRAGRSRIIPESRNLAGPIRTAPESCTLPLRIRSILGEHALRNPQPSSGCQHPGEFGKRSKHRPRKVQNAIDIHEIEHGVSYPSTGKVFRKRPRKTQVMLPRRACPMILRRRSACSSNIVRIRINADDEPRGSHGIRQSKRPLAFSTANIHDPLALDIAGNAHSAAALKPGCRRKRCVIGQCARR